METVIDIELWDEDSDITMSEIEEIISDENKNILWTDKLVYAVLKQHGIRMDEFEEDFSIEDSKDTIHEAYELLIWLGY